MKRVLTLAIVLAALIVGVVIVQSMRTGRVTKGSHVGADMRELLLPDLDLKNVAKVRIKDTTGEANLTIKDGQWVVAERSGYPADFAKLQRVLLDLREQKISRKQQVGKASWSKVNLVVPTGADTAGAGKLIELQDATGAVKSSFVIGDSEKSSGGNNNNGFMGGAEAYYVRIPAEENTNTVWIVSNSFYDLQPKPADWVNKAFLDVEKIKRVTVKPPAETDGWDVERADESGAFAFVTPGEGGAFDGDKAGIAGLLANAQFQDVLPKDKVTADFMKGATDVTITTFDGFTYKLKVIKKDDPSGEKYYITATVSADLPKERKAEAGEKDEDKKKKDEEFAKSKKELEEMFAKAKQVEGWMFEVSSYTVNAVLKKRPEVLKDKAADAPAESAAPGAPPSLPFPPGAAISPGLPADNNPAIAPRKPISVTTPPVAVPPLPPTEVKPAPSPTDNPAKPGTPAPPPDGAAKGEKKPE